MGMGLMQRLSRPQMISLSSGQDLSEIVGATSMSSAGIWVSSDMALSVAAVFACVRVVSEDVAKIPLDLYRRVPGGKEKAEDHPKHRLVHSHPNSLQTDYEWREMTQAHVELRGNAFSLITEYGGETRELIPVHPDLVTVEKDRSLFRVQYRIGGEVYPPERILHIKGLSADGVTGMTPLTVHRESIGFAIAVHRHGSVFFRQGARASGVAMHPGLLDEGAHERLKESVEAGISGDNVFRVLLLEEGMKWSQMSLSNEDAQFLDTKRHSRTEIAGIWRVAPHKIGDLSDATFSNIEAQERAYIMDSLNPRLTRFEKALNRKLLTEDEQREYFYEFNRDALLVGLTKERYEAYQIAMRNGTLSRNEWRRRENQNPVVGGDVYYISRDLATVDDEGNVILPDRTGEGLLASAGGT